MAEEALTLKQRKFIDAYLGEANGNALVSARLAGYAGSYSALGVTGHDNLKNPKIREEIERRIAEKAMGADEVLRRLAEQAQGVGAFVEVDDDGRPAVNVAQMKKAGLAHLIKSVKETANGQVVEFYDAQAALIQLGKFHKLWTERFEQDDPDLNNKIRRVMDSLAAVRQAAPSNGSGAGAQEAHSRT